RRQNDGLARRRCTGPRDDEDARHRGYPISAPADPLLHSAAPSILRPFCIPIPGIGRSLLLMIALPIRILGLLCWSAGSLPAGQVGRRVCGEIAAIAGSAPVQELLRQS